MTDREILAAQRSPEAYLSIPRERTRAFGIIAHVDHGKSTLADRLLELTGAIPKGGRKQYLDRLPVERARGITVKAQSVTLTHECPITKETYLLNLIDTPGHADFSFEVSRSLLACVGALLLVDATQGVQAQTIATFFLALETTWQFFRWRTKWTRSTPTPSDARADGRRVRNGRRERQR